MVRKLKADQLASLRRLTRLKKSVLHTELEVLRRRVSDKQAEITRLNTPDETQQSSVEEMLAMTRWLDWKKGELRKLNADHALLRLEHDRFAEKVGRAVAEDAVVERLLDKALSDQRLLQRQKLEENALHLLPNNIGDQDV